MGCLKLHTGTNETPLKIAYRKENKGDFLRLDYYPFGMQMPGRQFNAGEYRYGFNGQEADDEIYGTGNSYTAEFWQYDPRLGRRWNVDPVVKEWESPYACFANNPVDLVDPNGNQAGEPGGDKKKTLAAGVAGSLNSSPAGNAMATASTSMGNNTDTPDQNQTTSGNATEALAKSQSLNGDYYVYFLDQSNRPADNGISGTSYTADVFIVTPQGIINGPYNGSTYPNSISNTNNATSHNTVDEGVHDFSNVFGHTPPSTGITQQGLNLGQNRVNIWADKNSPGYDPNGNPVTTIFNANVHSGQSNNGNYNSRGSEGCLTINPSDVSDFFDNFNWSANGVTGNDHGRMRVSRNQNYNNTMTTVLKSQQIKKNTRTAFIAGAFQVF